MADVKEYIGILPQNTLKGKALGISVSESEDLGRLGLVEDHFRLALAEIARTILVLGGTIYYGGHLIPDGYTVYLIDELQKYGRRDRPLKICLHWVEHQTMDKKELDTQRRKIGLFGELLLLDIDGNLLPSNGIIRDQSKEITNDDLPRSLTGLRNFMATSTSARILLGGKRRGYLGSMPGLVEEALLSLQAKRALFLAGGFGGVCLDIIEALHPDRSNWFPKRLMPLDDRTSNSLMLLHKTAKDMRWDGSHNGLSSDEMALLAATYRPSEIATLVGLGLGRLNNDV